MNNGNNNSLQNAAKKVLVWDLPTRIFHWLFVLSFIAAWVTNGEDRYLYEHVFAGYVFFALLIFRLIWGFSGSHYAKFTNFAYSKSIVVDYIKALFKGGAKRYVGHNPAGGMAIFIILFLATILAVSGLMVLGGEEHHGPLKDIVSYSLGSEMKEIHELAYNALLVLLFIHLVGVLFESLYHKENLISAMLSGYKPAAEKSVPVKVHALLGLTVLTIVAASAAYYFKGYAMETKDKPFVPYSNTPLAMNETYSSECGDCHLAFHPSLLPARSWKLMLKQQDHHFGEDLSLDEETIKELSKFMLAHSAEKGITEASHKIYHSIPADRTPLRITETRYWKRKHREINDRYWKMDKVKSKANCGACHLDAKTGWFEDSNMRLPK